MKKYTKSDLHLSFNNLHLYDVFFEGLPSNKGFKISIVGKKEEDVFDIYHRLHSWLEENRIAHKIATRKRLLHPDYEQSKKLMTIYVPDSMDIFDLMNKIEPKMRSYKGWHDIRLPFKSYEHFSGAIFFRNDRDAQGNYIAAK